MKVSRREFSKAAISILPLDGIAHIAGSPLLTLFAQTPAKSTSTSWRSHYDAGWIQQRLIEGLLDYWLRSSVAANGFIQENLGRDWKPYGQQREATVNGQGRQLYCFATAYGLTGRGDYLDAVHRCAKFLLGMRDPEFGGYFDRVSPDLKVIDDRKTAYASFAVFSLITAGRVTNESRYVDAALTAWKEIRDKMRDGPTFYFSMKRDFSAPAPLPAARPSASQNSHAPPSPPPFSERDHLVNVHMFEALLGLYETTRSADIWNQIQAQLHFVEQSFDQHWGYFPEAYDEHWKPLPPKTFNVGHLFEWASLLSRAVELGADARFIQLGNRSIDLGLRLGKDASTGGVWMNALATGGPASRYMIWWTQCETLKATARYAILHGRADLWAAFDANLRFVRNNFLDHEEGGWFESWVPGIPRSSANPESLIKGAVDGPEWGSYHQTSCLSDLIHLSKVAG